MKLFILFQGLRNNDKIWNHNKSQFLTQLKKRGTIFTYENKIYNTSYYNKENPEYNDYSPNIDFDLSYFNIKKHLEIVFEMITQTIQNALEYEWIPIGFSLGSSLALIFSNIYNQYCKSCILLDPIKNISPKNNNNIIKLFHSHYNKIIKTNKELNKMKEIIQTEKNNKKEIEYLHYFFIYYITKWISKNRKRLQFKIPIYSFINIYNPDKYEEKYKYWNNKAVNHEHKYLKKYINSKLHIGKKVGIIGEGYYPIFLKNAGHFVFSGKKECKMIMDVIALKTE